MLTLEGQRGTVGKSGPKHEVAVVDGEVDGTATFGGIGTWSCLPGCHAAL